MVNFVCHIEMNARHSSICTRLVHICIMYRIQINHWSVCVYIYIFQKKNHQKMTFFDWWWKRIMYSSISDMQMNFHWCVNLFVYCVQAHTVHSLHCSVCSFSYMSLLIFYFMFWTMFSYRIRSVAQNVLYYMEYEYGFSPYHSRVYLLFFVNLSLLFCIRIKFRYIAYSIFWIDCMDFKLKLKFVGKKRNFSRREKMLSNQHIIIKNTIT